MFFWKLFDLKTRSDLNGIPVVITEDTVGDDRVAVKLTHQGVTIQIRVKRSNLVSTQNTNTTYQAYNDALQQTMSSDDERLREFAIQMSEKRFDEAATTAKNYTLRSV